MSSKNNAGSAGGDSNTLTTAINQRVRNICGKKVMTTLKNIYPGADDKLVALAEIEMDLHPTECFDSLLISLFKYGLKKRLEDDADAMDFRLELSVEELSAFNRNYFVRNNKRGWGIANGIIFVDDYGAGGSIRLYDVSENDVDYYFKVDKDGDVMFE